MAIKELKKFRHDGEMVLLQVSGSHGAYSQFSVITHQFWGQSSRDMHKTTTVCEDYTDALREWERRTAQVLAGTMCANAKVF